MFGFLTAAEVPGRTQARSVIGLADGPGEPLEGATVLVLDRGGNEIARTQTDSRGMFAFSELPLISARLLAQAPGHDDLSLFVTLVPESVVQVGRSFPVSREQAIILAERTGTLLTCTQNPLPPGTVIGPFVPEDRVHVVGEDHEWFLMSDANLDSPFAHEVEYIYVNARTGAVSQENFQWWPSLNSYSLWATAGDLAYTPDITSDSEQPREYQFLGSADIEGLPPADDARSELPPNLEKIVARGDPRDNFALLFAGTPESWFLNDVRRMEAWCTRNNFRPENVHVVKPHPPGDEPTEASLLPIDTKIQQAMDALKADVQKRHAEGGHPNLFVFATSHGVQTGRLWVADSLGELAFGRLTDSVRMEPVELLLPVHEISACKTRILLACCKGRSHLERLVTVFERTTIDYQIITSSGYNNATGRSLEQGFFKAVKGFFKDGDFDTSFLDASVIGTKMAFDFVPSASWNEAEWTFSQPLGATLLRTFQEIQKLQDTKTKDDRIHFDPDRPDPCASEFAIFTDAGGFIYDRAVNEDGSLQASNNSLVSAGAGAGFLSVSSGASTVFTPTNLGVVGFLLGEGGELLGPVPGSPAPIGGSTALVSGQVLAGEQFLYVSEFDGTVFGYRIDLETGGLSGLPNFPVELGGTMNSVVAAAHPAGNFLYSTDIGSNQIRGFRVGTDGTLTVVPGSPFPALPVAKATVSPNGRFLYVGEALSPNLIGFSIEDSGSLTPIPGGPFPGSTDPQFLEVHPNGHFLFVGNPSDGTVAAYAIDSASGVLTPIPSSPFMVGSFFTGMDVFESGRFLYVSNGLTNNSNLYGFAIDEAGTLTPVPGSPFSAPNPIGVRSSPHR